MNELAIFLHHAGVNQNMADRAIFGPHARFIVMQRLAASQSLQDVFDHLLIDVKFCDGVADVLVAGVTEDFELGSIRPQNDSVRANPMEGSGGVLKKVSELMFAPPEFCQSFRPADLILWHGLPSIGLFD